MRKNRFFEIGAIVLAIGAVATVVGGIGEVGYYQCIAASGAACTGAGSTELFTVFYANSDVLNVGLSVALIGAVIMIGGSITNYVATLADEMKASMGPSRVCPKCGTQLALTAKFCPSCGNKLGE